MAMLKSYTDLVLHAQQGVDYDLTVRDRGAAATILALHGGGIAPLTGELASAIADETWNLYLLRGLRSMGNDALRLPTLRYSEMRCDELLRRSALALAITDANDGDDAADAPIRVGGQNEGLVAALLTALRDAGLAATLSTDKVERLALQCYNRAQQGGALLTLPRSARQWLLSERLLSDGPNDPKCTARWTTLVSAVRQTLAAALCALESDLPLTLARFERATRAVQEAGLLGPKSHPGGAR